MGDPCVLQSKVEPTWEREEAVEKLKESVHGLSQMKEECIKSSREDQKV